MRDLPCTLLRPAEVRHQIAERSRGDVHIAVSTGPTTAVCSRLRRERRAGWERVHVERDAGPPRPISCASTTPYMRSTTEVRTRCARTQGHARRHALEQRDKPAATHVRYYVSALHPGSGRALSGAAVAHDSTIQLYAPVRQPRQHLRFIIAPTRSPPPAASAAAISSRP